MNFLGKELKFYITFLSSLLKTDLPKKESENQTEMQ